LAKGALPTGPAFLQRWIPGGDFWAKRKQEQEDGFTAADQMNCSIEEIFFSLKGMGIAAWAVMALNDQDLLSDMGQQCCSREATHAAPYNDHIIKFLSNAHCSNLSGSSHRH
jgi:hypothetical protein